MKYCKELIYFLILFLFSVSATLVASARIGMIVRVLSQQEMEVNLGKEDGLIMGQDLTVFRLEKSIAYAKVQKIDDTSCVIRIMESSDVPEVGDSVAKDIEALKNSTSQSSSVQTYVAPTQQASPVQNYTAPPPASSDNNYAGNPQEGYFNLLSERTRVIVVEPDTGGYRNQFTGTSKADDIIQDLWSIFSVIRIGDPVYAVTSGINIATRPRVGGEDYDASGTGTPVTPASSRITALLWDEALCKGYADYWASQKSANSEETAKFMQDQMGEHSINSNLVFQLVIDNATAYPVNLSPFKWRVYVIDKDGNRYSVERYDPVFEKEVKPGERADGFIYFPKVNSGKVELHIDEVFGDNHTMDWQIK